MHENHSKQDCKRRQAIIKAIEEPDKVEPKNTQKSTVTNIC